MTLVMQLTADEKEQAARAIIDRHRGKDLPDIMTGLHMELLELLALEQRVSALEERKKR